MDLTPVAGHRRGHGSLYDALSRGSVDVVPAGLPMPQAADGRLVLAVDVSDWLRPDASDQRGAFVLPRLRPQRTDPGPVHSRPAVLVRRRSRIGPHVLMPIPGRSAGRGPRTDAHGPGDVQTGPGALDLPAAGRAPAQARQGVPLRRAGDPGEPDAATVQITDRYGTARAMAWDHIHPSPTTRSPGPTTPVNSPSSRAR